MPGDEPDCDKEGHLDDSTCGVRGENDYARASALAWEAIVGTCSGGSGPYHPTWTTQRSVTLLGPARELDRFPSIADVTICETRA